MSALSIDSSIRTCKVTTDNAPRIASDRFLNPNNMACIVWNGMDSVGRQVCSDSFTTKAPGCNSAGDMVVKENFLRPNYSAYINLNPAGIQGNMYNDENYCHTQNFYDSRGTITGNFGNQWASHTQPSCSLRALDAVNQTAASSHARSDKYMYLAGDRNPKHASHRQRPTR